MAIKDGTLVYYKSESETDFGCRGAISLSKAVVTKHELDEMRFDVSVGDCVWYLRAASVEEREKWIQSLESFKQRGDPQHNKLRRQGSAMSLTSNTFSSHSNSSKVRHQALAEKLSECETFRDILCRQIDTLQNYFDVCSTIAASLDSPGAAGEENKQSTTDLLQQQGLHAVDFKGEAITFKATTAGLLATLQYCTELMGQREEQLKKRLEKEQLVRRQAEEKVRRMEVGERETRQSRSGPDYEE